MEKSKTIGVTILVMVAVIAASVGLAVSKDRSHIVRAECRTLLRGKPCQRVAGLNAEGECVYQDAQDGTICPPKGNMFCNPSCVCQDGKAVRVMRDCDDNNPCTKDSCGQGLIDTSGSPALSGLHLTKSMCLHDVLEDYTPCSNKDFTVPGHCKAGECALPDMDIVPE